MPKKKVYISSTFKDLESYRGVVINEFEGIYSESCELSRVMEYMYDTGKSIPDISVCIEEVKSSNLYLLILGNKMGSFVPDSNKTYTEMEYDTAMENKEQTSIFRFVNSNVQPGDLDNHEKYLEFRAKLKGLPVHEYKDLDTFRLAFFKFMSYYVQKPQMDQNGRKYYFTLATLIGGIGLLCSFVASYLVRQTGEKILIQICAGLIVTLIFACVVVYILKNIIFPTANSTYKKI